MTADPGRHRRQRPAGRATAPSFATPSHASSQATASSHATAGRHATARRAWRAVVAGGLLLLAAAVAGLAARTQARHSAVPLRPVPRLAAPGGPVARPAAAAATGRAARPTGLIIPVIGVRAPLIRLGLTPSGTLQVPSRTTVAGWFADSPRPGDIGSSVIAGHIDSARGPGVFFRLRLLHRGQLIYVRRADGTVAVFRVADTRAYPKNQFPTEQVYGPVPDAQLHLITCGGTFDPGLRSYLGNVVVYAVAVGGPHPRLPRPASRARAPAPGR